jgi:hypothetical protein
VREDAPVTEPDAQPAPPPALAAVVGEVETHVAEAGWDQPPQLFALVETEQLLRAEPQLAQSMGIVATRPGSLTPVAQEPLADGPLDEVLARLQFGEDVLGVVLAHEVVVLPPSVEAELEDVPDPAGYAAEHPAHREVRMVVGVVRGGASAAVLRLRGQDGADDERVTGPDLAPGLTGALLATLDQT